MCKKLTAEHFWSWFERNNEDYHDLDAKSNKECEYLMNEINVHLRTCSTLKYIEIKSNHARNRTELIVTAGDQPGKLEMIDEFVAAAPRIPGWKFHALYPPCAAHSRLEDILARFKITPDQLYCDLYYTYPDEPVDIIVYFEGYDDRKQAALQDLMHRIIYNLLGERVYYQEIGALICDYMDGFTENDLIKLTDLPKHISRRKSMFVVNKKGLIKISRKIKM